MNPFAGQDLKCGFELELYLPQPENATHSYAVEKLKQTLSDSNVGGYTCERDASLRQTRAISGAEVKFTKPVKLKSAISKIKKLQNVVNTLSPIFMETEGEFKGPSTILDKVIRNDGNYNGSTGLHVHFDASHDVTALDIIRLLHRHSIEFDSLCENGWRTNGRWAPNSTNVLNKIISDIRNPRKQRLSLSNYSDKYQSVNFLNIYNRNTKQTIEFRYASGALITDMNALTKYMVQLKNIWDKCVTGDPYHRIGNIELKQGTNLLDFEVLNANGEKSIKFMKILK